MWLRLVTPCIVLLCGTLIVAQQPAAPNTNTPKPQPNVEQNLFGWIVELEKQLPSSWEGFVQLDMPQVVKCCNNVEQWTIEITRIVDPNDQAKCQKQVQLLLFSKQRVDQLLDKLLAQRQQLVTGSANQHAQQRLAISNYLQMTSSVNDLAGRVRYSQRDGFDTMVDIASRSATQLQQIINEMIQARTHSGAAVMRDYLVEIPTNETEQKILTNDIKQSICRLIAVTGSTDLLGDLVSVLKNSQQPAGVRFAAAQAIMELGLPQPARIDSDPNQRTPEITPAQLFEQLQKIPVEQLSTAQQTERKELQKLVSSRMRNGVTDNSYRVGRMELQAGDWLLMRNPSPYNLFTDLAPGLFTHVGVLAWEEGTDGVRRLVVVDLPERGTKIPATNVDLFLQRTLNYVFLRHNDPQVAAQMGQAAADCIGNPSEFDLTFRTARLKELQGKPLKGARIHTYCAGFLLLCAQQTGRPRNEFFPLDENPTPGKARQNFEQLGLQFGEQFVSPTGALFSSSLQIVGRRDPMYDPRREVEEAVFDHFAIRCQTGTLIQSPDTTQAIRTKLAEASKENPLLAQALAATANVSANMDLVAGAKTGAVVETLDDIAFGNSREYIMARTAILDGPTPPVVAERTPEQVAELKQLRERHAELAKRWDARTLPPRQLRIELVNFYSAKGKKELDARFFPKDGPVQTTQQVKKAETDTTVKTPAKQVPGTPTPPARPVRPTRPLR
jgi:hypothetical protein